MTTLHRIRKITTLQMMSYDRFSNDEKWQLYTESEKWQLYKWWVMIDFQIMRNDNFTQNQKNDNLQVMTFDTFVNDEKRQIYTE